jgi:hypothetical protein
MICPILTAIEIIDEAKAICDGSDKARKLLHKGVQQLKNGSSVREAGSLQIYAHSKFHFKHLHALGDRIVMLREETDCPRELVEAIDDLLVGMIRNRSLIKWKMTGVPARPVYSPEAIEVLRGMMEKS